MSKLLKSLSEEEIRSIDSNGKGCNYYALALCATGYDSGTCGWVYKNCGPKQRPSSGGCKSGGGCTCRR